jgi:hypothetical protein
MTFGAMQQITLEYWYVPHYSFDGPPHRHAGAAGKQTSI